MDTMKAIRIHQNGGPGVLQYEDAPRPEPAADEVLVRVHAAGVNPADWKTREGFQATRRPLDFPHIPGWDISGIVESVGSAVTEFKPGDGVYGMIRFPNPGAAYAQYATAPTAHIARKPTRLDHIQTAALPLAALTAWQALFDTAHLQAGQTVVINGAAGGVGHFAVQLAKAQGAHVVAVASQRSRDFVRSLGADSVIDYQSAEPEKQAADVAVVFDTIGGPNGPRFAQAMRRGGSYVSITWTFPAEDQVAALGIATHPLLVHPDAHALAELAQWVDRGVVTPVIERAFPLAEARQAHELGEEGHVRGKIVLDCLI